MILTVTLNAALDKTHLLPELRLGCVNRPLEVLAMAGGKGLNVARVLRALDETVLATGIVAGHTGAFIESCLDAEQIPHAFHRLTVGESRTCLAVVSRTPGSCQTEFNERGPFVSEAEFAHFKERYARLLPRARWVALSGSMPPGLDGEAYLVLMAMARAAGKPVSLDTSDIALEQALAGRPDLVKPNQGEAEALLGHPVTPETIRQSLDELLERGARTVALSLGSLGAAFATRDEAWYVAAPAVEVINPIGSGDSFLACLIASLQNGLPLAVAGGWAVAAGSANAAVPGAAACSRAQIEKLLTVIRPVPLAEATWLRPADSLRSL